MKMGRQVSDTKSQNRQVQTSENPFTMLAPQRRQRPTYPFVELDLAEFEPRVGFAWNPRGERRWCAAFPAFSDVLPPALRIHIFVSTGCAIRAGHLRLIPLQPGMFPPRLSQFGNQTIRLGTPCRTSNFVPNGIT